jgi:hypothetical protein
VVIAGVVGVVVDPERGRCVVCDGGASAGAPSRCSAADLATAAELATRATATTTRNCGIKGSRDVAV